MEIGSINALEVLRESDIAYVLFDGETEIFMHKREITENIVIGTFVDVFLYYDSMKRVCATTKKPIIDVDTYSVVEVVDVVNDLGVFVNIEIGKDMLLSIDDLPEDVIYWPRLGSKLLCRLRASKNQLCAQMASRSKLLEFFDGDVLEEGTTVKAVVFQITKDGIVVITEDLHDIFVYKSNVRSKCYLGQTIEVKIIKTLKPHKYNGSMIEQKELMIEGDSKLIFEYLTTKGGVIPFTDKSSPDDIMRVFNMSKAAFKRALGILYKKKLVLLNKESTELVNK